MAQRRERPVPGLTKAEAAKRLHVSVRTIERLLSKHVLRGRQVRRDNRWAVEIPVQSIERVEDKREISRRQREFDRDLGIGFTFETRGGLPDYFVFGPPGSLDPSRLPKFKLSVGLRDLYRFAFDPAAQREAIRRELKGLLGSEAEAFAVHFLLDGDRACQEVAAIVRRVQPHAPDDLSVDVATRLLTIALHTLGDRRFADWRSFEGYVATTARNLQRDTYRATRRQIVAREALDFDRLTADPEEDDEETPSD